MTNDPKPAFAKRLERARILRGLKTPKEASTRFGWVYETYIQHEQGLRGISRQSKKYADAFRVSEAWLLTGEGEGPDDHVSSEDVASTLSGNDEKAGNTINVRSANTDELNGLVREIDARAGAGNGTVGEHEVFATRHGDTYLGHKVVSEWVFPPSYLRHELHAQPGSIIILEVIGDSMSPTLESGDRLIIDTGHSKPSPDGIYVIDEGHGPLVKRVQLIRRSDPPEIRVISDNKNHEAYTLRLDEVRIVGRVSGRVTRM